MSAASPSRSPMSRKALLGSAFVVLLIAAMALDTKVVRQGSEQDVQADVFSAEAYGPAHFPDVQADVEKRAAEAVPLAAAIAADKAAAGKQYGVAASAGPVIPVKFTGVVGEGKSGVYQVAVEGLPPEVKVRVQTGPAINGTDLRDATGQIVFGQFVNQIQYQDAGSALNNEMKKQVLAGIDTASLAGKTVTVVGVFKLVNPKNWLVTPVRISVP
jgi:predicted lipoprotein